MAEKEAAPRAETTEETSTDKEKSEKGYKSSWNRLKANIAKLRAKETVEEGMTTEVAQKAADEAIRKVWFAIHEFCEDLALSFIDLMLFTGPLCAIVATIRFVGICAFKFIVTIKIKGVTVSLFPIPRLWEISVRSKTFLVILLSSVLWLIIIALLVAATHTCDVVSSVFGESFAGAVNFLCKGVSAVTPQGAIIQFLGNALGL